MSEDRPQMTARDAIELLELFDQNDIEVAIDGGRGVDALPGRQTRIHEDLDVAAAYRDVPRIRTLLEAKGHRDVPWDDNWERNFVLGNEQGHLFDLHSCTFDENDYHDLKLLCEKFGIELPGEFAGFALRAPLREQARR